MKTIEMQATDASAGIHREMCEIDWEQRRYEVARSIYSMVLTNTPDGCMPSSAALTSIVLANVLVRELKKFNEKEKGKRG